MASLAKILSRSKPSTDGAIDDRGPSPLAVKATRIALWLLVALGALGGLAGTFRSSPGPIPLPSVGPPAAVPADVMGRAEAAVREWLTTGELGSLPEATEEADGDRLVEVLWTSAVSSRVVERGYWAVTIAADVKAAGEATTARWFLEIGVLRSGGSSSAVGPPAVVSSPPSPEVELREPEASPERDDPMTTTAVSFLRSLLTGSGEVARYMAPGSSVPPLTPAPFDTVTVGDISTVRADPAASTIRVEASAITAGEVEVALSYELVMVERDGRWEIEALSGAPTLSGDDGTSTRPPGTPSTTTNPPVPGA